jgi:hypothetical protein
VLPLLDIVVTVFCNKLTEVAALTKLRVRVLGLDMSCGASVLGKGIGRDIERGLSHAFQ